MGEAAKLSARKVRTDQLPALRDREEASTFLAVWGAYLRYLTKVWEGFAWMVIISGAFMGMAFAFMWFVSMWQMWFWKVPAGISENQGKVPCLHSEQ